MSKATRSCRHSGAVGSKPTKVTQYVMKNFTPKIGKVLDLGSGKVPRQTELLRQEGFDVGAYDMPGNMEIGVHISPRERYIDTRWDVILLSNVLNVQSSVKNAVEMINIGLHSGAGYVIFNLPNSPCYWDSDGIAHQRQQELVAEMERQNVPTHHMATHKYGGGVLYVIDRMIPPRQQPQIRGCMFPRY